MKSLFIDTSLNRIIVALIDNNTILSFYNEECYRDFSSQVMKIIDEQFHKTSLSVQDIDKLFVVVGPGSFTGIRIGLTIAKVIGWSLNKKIIPISSLELLATTPINKEYIVSYIDARHNCVYAGIYDKNLNVYMSDRYIEMSELVKLINDDAMAAVTYDTPIDMVSNNKPQIDVLRVINKYINAEGVDAHLIKPNYLKLTEAEVKMNADN